MYQLFKRLIKRRDIARQVISNREKIKAVSRGELNTFLGGLGVLSSMNDGKANCKFCNQPITEDNLHAVFPESGAVKLVCDGIVCQEELVLYLGEKRKKK